MTDHDPAARLTIELDALLTSLTDENARALRAAAPTAMRDQLDAASRDARAVAELAMTMTGGIERNEDRHPAATPEWLRLGAFHALVEFLTGAGRTCLHDPRPRNPQPLFSAAWKPGLVVCAGCTHLFAVKGEASKLCDGCGHVCAGPEHGDGIYEVTVMAGPLGYCAGLCTDCYADAVKTET